MTNADTLLVQTLGDLRIFAAGRELMIPSSRKTRSLLGYLVLCGAPQRRERLCELFWDVPNDPRGALRWSLSKLRGTLKEYAAPCLIADRERIAFDLSAVRVDFHDAVQLVADESAGAEALAAAWRACSQALLENCDLPRLDDFRAWLERERMQAVRLRARLARRLAADKTIAPDEAVGWADAWLDDTPFDHAAAAAAVSARIKAGRAGEAETLRERLNERFASANLAQPEWPAKAARPSDADATPPISNEEADRALRMRQRVRFARAHDGVSLAWATVGADDLAPVVKAANWLSHLELDWEAPIWSPLFRDLARRRRLIRYDERGCGLSDWNVAEISFDTFVADLEAVVDAAGIDRFPLLGISQGASVSIEYAVRHPERVSHLILFGGYAAGWRHLATPEEAREREAIMVLTEAGWGRDDPAYRHLFSQTFMPGATNDELSWFDDFQRRTTSPRNAVRFLDAFSQIDVRHRLGEIRVPTLVLHSRGDLRISIDTGRALAAAIPDAEFVSLDSPNHLLLGREPASAAFLAAVRSFLDHESV